MGEPMGGSCYWAYQHYQTPEQPEHPNHLAQHPAKQHGKAKAKAKPAEVTPPARGAGRGVERYAAAAPEKPAAAKPAQQSPPPEVKESGTTVMLRNIPNKYTQDTLLSLLDDHHFHRKYDFVYLPMDFRNAVNLGYAFVNLLTHAIALELMDSLQGYDAWSFESSKVCEVSWAHPHQGFEEHVERYRNSPVMHPTMPDEYKPMIFKDGVRVAFPQPTKAIRAPKLRPVRERPNANADAQDH